MITRASLLVPLLAAASVFCPGCGYIADPQPPTLHIPRIVRDLTAHQRGDKLVVDFTIPSLSTDGVVLTHVDGVDLRGGPGTGAVFDLNRWAEQARKIESEIEKPGPAHLEVPVNGWAGQDVVLGVRVAGPKGKFSDWSNLIALPIVPPLPSPADVRAEAVREGVRVDWQMAQERTGLWFRIYRRAPDQKDTVLLASAEKASYVDRDTQYGKEYFYSIQAVQKVGQVEAESAVSEPPVSITPVDTFAPAVPAGLAAIAATGSIQLSWDPNTEPDLKNYRVYRAADGEPFRQIGEADTPHYGDRAVEAGKKYRYTVAAIDQTGNLSAQSAPVEVTAQ